MTRRRIIAGVILLAAVAVAVPLVPGVWRAVAYVQLPTESGPLTAGGVRIPEALGGPVDSETVVFGGSRLTLQEKRYALFPGEQFIVPDQVCTLCDAGTHMLCFPRHIEIAWFIANGTIVELPPDFRCTCTDPSHDD